MDKRRKEQLKQLLETKLGQYQESLRIIREQVTAPPELGGDEADKAVDGVERSFALERSTRESNMILAVQDALNRLARDEYGYCSECEEEIEFNRLRANPIATLCLEHQELKEVQARHFRKATSSGWKQANEPEEPDQFS